MARPRSLSASCAPSLWPAQHEEIAPTKLAQPGCPASRHTTLRKQTASLEPNSLRMRRCLLSFGVAATCAPGRGKRSARLALEGRIEYGAEENFVARDSLAYCSAAALLALPLAADVGDFAPAIILLVASLTVYLGSRAPPFRTGGSLIGIDLRGSPLILAIAAPWVAVVALLGLYSAQKIGLDVNAFYTGIVCIVGLIAQESLIQEGLAALRPGPSGELRVYSIALSLGVTLFYFLSQGPLHLAASNVIAWSLGLLAIRVVPVGSFPVAAVLLVGLLCYDVAFVFKSDVMITVAKGIDAPVLIQVAKSRAADAPTAILGLGDLLAPGAAIAFLQRFGASMKGLYARNAVAAYSLGLLAGLLANLSTNRGQPALFYVVPAVLGSALLTAIGSDEVAPLLSFQEGPSACEDVPGLRAGKFLTKTALQDDGMFGGSVVLLLEHEHTKESLGVIVNRPLREADRQDLLLRAEGLDAWWLPFGLRSTARCARRLLGGDVRLGGPVGLETFPLEPAVVLHRDRSVQGARVAIQGPSEEGALLWSYLSEWDPNRDVPGAILCVGLSVWQQEQLAGEVRKRRWGWADARPGEVSGPSVLLESLEESGRVRYLESDP